MNTVSLKAEHLSCVYDGNTVLDDLSLSFESGTLYGILGPNGSGKTTLLRHLCGLARPQRGTVLLNGDKPLRSVSRKALARRISFLPQNNTFPDIPVEDFVSYGRFPHLSFSRKLSETDRTAVQAAMAQAGVMHLALRSLSTLSGGERQRVYFAMLLAQDADIVLLDEPTTYLDARHKFEITDLCRTMCEKGKTVIAVMHDLPLALSACDRILLLKDGRRIAMDTPCALYESGALDRVFDIRLHRETLHDEVFFAELPPC